MKVVKTSKERADEKKIKLDGEDLRSPAYIEIKRYVNFKVGALLTKLENPEMTDRQNQELKGGIAELRDMLNKFEPKSYSAPKKTINIVDDELID